MHRALLAVAVAMAALALWTAAPGIVMAQIGTTTTSTTTTTTPTTSSSTTTTLLPTTTATTTTTRPPSSTTTATTATTAPARATSSTTATTQKTTTTSTSTSSTTLLPPIPDEARGGIEELPADGFRPSLSTQSASTWRLARFLLLWLLGFAAAAFLVSLVLTRWRGGL